MRRWDDYAKMRQCGVSKTPGCGWIDVGARAHEFCPMFLARRPRRFFIDVDL
jgi:hypothetical protein